MTKETFFLCDPLVFKKGVSIYPPTVRQVINDQKYNMFVRVLTYSQEEVEDEFTAAKKKLDIYPTPIEYLLNNSYHDKGYEQLCLAAFKFFLKTDVVFLYEQKLIIVGSLKEVLKQIETVEQLITITEEEFFDFQNLIREAVGKKTIDKPNPNEHPRIRAMKAKARYRDKIKEKQNAKNGASLFTTMAAICCMGIGITPLNIGELSYVAFNSIIAMYQQKEKYELDTSSLLAGADAKKVKPVYWIKNLED